MDRAILDAVKAGDASRAVEIHDAWDDLRRVMKAHDGWIQWGGGKCPVDGDTEVEVKFRYGGMRTALRASLSYWGHDGDGHDIIAYRIAK